MTEFRLGKVVNIRFGNIMLKEMLKERKKQNLICEFIWNRKKT
jgi:hypothetical protein